MASKLTPNATRTDAIRIPIDEIAFDESQNGRFEPHEDHSIRQLAESILENGQLQPVVVRKQGDNVVVSAGFRRYLAVKLINEDAELSANLPAPLPLLALRRDQNGEEAFKTNIIENHDRKETTVIDKTHNQRRLRDDFGWKDARIAELFSCTVGYVSQLKSLLQLTTKTQSAVHNGVISLGVALNMVALTEAEQDEIAVKAVDDGKVDAEEVNETVRTRKQSQGKGLRRTAKEVKKFFVAIAERAGEEVNDEPRDEPLHKFATQLVKFLDGTIGGDTMKKSIRAFRDAE